MALSSNSRLKMTIDNLAGEGGREDAVAELPHSSGGDVIGKVMEYCIDPSLTLSKYVGAGQSIDGKTIVENLWRCAAHELEIKEEEAAVAMLPHDLLAEEVLTRLPAKPLMRFKSVSKLWCSTICDPCFVKAHSARSRSRSAGGDLLLVCPFDHDDTDLSFDFFRATLPSPPIPDDDADVPAVHQFTVSPHNCNIGVMKEEIIDVLHDYDATTEVVNDIV